MPLAEVFIRWVHLFAAIAWIGGVFFYLSVLMPSLGDIDPGQARRLSQLVGMRMRSVMLVAMGSLLLTGLWMFSGIMQSVSFRDWFLASPYSRALSAKILLALLAIANGSVIGFVIAPKLVDAIEAGDEARARTLGKRMGILTGVGFVFGVGITICLAVMHAGGF